MKVSPKTHTKPLGQEWETYCLQAVKEISVQPLADHKLNKKTSMATHDKAYKIYRISSEKSLKQQIKQAATTDNPGKGRESNSKVAALF